MSSKLPTITEIARQLNISVSTVSRALHNHPGIGLRTKARVQELAKQLNYEPNQTALFFQQGKTYTIGVILPELSENFFSAAISGIEDAAEKLNYTVLLGQSHDNEERERKIVATMKNHRVDGLLVSISKNTNNQIQLSVLSKFYQTLRIKPNIKAITASTISIWIKPDALYTKNPSNHPITSITAIRYNMLLIV